MIVRFIMMAVLSASVSLGAAAEEAIPVDSSPSFETRFEADVEGGYFRMGRSEWAARQLLGAGGGLAGRFQIEDAYRTEEYSSGVALMLVDAEGFRYAKVGFGDEEGRSKPVMFVQVGSAEPGEEWNETVGWVDLPLEMDAVGSFGVEFSEGRTISLWAAGERLEVELDFEPVFVLAQVYCAKGWVQFDEMELIS